MGFVRSCSTRKVAGAVLCVCALVLLLAAALPPAASALTSRFSINEGDAYSRFLEVDVGDGGWSPFFQPAIVVWDGGSIISGHRADEGYDYPTQTLTLVPHTCRSFVSSTGSARIADMIAGASTEVDARFRAAAEANLCLVQAGGGDFGAGAQPATVYQGLREYCTGRRAAGFTVVVLTVLPRSDPLTFEVARLAYNQMVRDTWTEFADGLVDVAADSRIGDTLDDLDRRYYRSDAVHPNNAGYAVMANVTAPVLNSLIWKSSTCEMRIREDDGAWSDWRRYVAQSTWVLSEGDGKRTVEAEFRDGASSATVSDTIFIDTVRPTAQALRDVRVRRGRQVTLPCSVTDPEPCGPTATVTVKVTTTGGRTLKQFVRHRQPVDSSFSTRFTCRLPKGSYRYVVYARDTAGNLQAGVDSARLTVR